MAGKKNFGKLTPKKIINKKNVLQTVYIDPDKDLTEVKVTRHPETEKKVVTKSGKVILNPDTPEAIKEKYNNKKYALTWKIMKSGKWKDGKLQLSETSWKKLIEEHMPFIFSMAKRFSYGLPYGDRFESLKQTGTVGFLEGVNRYGKFHDPKNPPDFGKVVFKYVKGRILEEIGNRLSAGVRIPQYLKDPYNDYLKVREKLESSLGVQPTLDQVGQVLSKIWTKKTFYPQYELTGSDEDKLPMSGFVSVKKETTEKTKEQKHAQNIHSIEDKYTQEMDRLDQQFYLSQNKSKEERKKESEIIESLKSKADVKRDEYNSINTVRLAKQEAFNNEKIKVNAEYEKTKNPGETLKKKFQFYNNDRSIFEVLKEDNEKLNKAKGELDSLTKDYEMAKEFYGDINETEYERRKSVLQNKKSRDLEDESRRYNSDKSSSVIPGIMDRIKEFEQIRSFREHPLDLNFDDAEGEGASLLERTVIPVMNEDDIINLKEEHENKKELLRDSLNVLAPVYKESFELYTGLHKKSKPSQDRLWGELATRKEITGFLEKRYSDLLGDGGYEKVISMIKNASDKSSRELYAGQLPFLRPEYRKNIEQILKDHKEYLKTKPKSEVKKVKISDRLYKKKLKDYKERRAKAKEEWTKWRKTQENLTQKKSTKKYESIKARLKAGENDYPTKFVVKDVKATKQDIEAWRKNHPKIFIESGPRREAWVSEILQDSRDIVRKVTPLKVVRDLLSVHRKLVEQGIEFTKGLSDEFDPVDLKSYTDFSEVYNWLYSDTMRVVYVEKAMATLFGEYFEKAESGTWSEALRDRNAPAKWVTLKGKKVLIKLNNDGSATIIYSKDKSMEHLRITGKKSKEHGMWLKDLSKEKSDMDEGKKKEEEAKKEEEKKKDEKEKTVKKKKSEMTDEEIRQATFEREKKHKINLMQKEIKDTKRTNMSEALGVDVTEIGKKDENSVIDTAKPDFINEAEKDIQEEKRVSQALKKVDQIIKEKNLESKDLTHIKRVILTRIANKATEKLINDPARELIGETLTEPVPSEYKASTGHEDIDKVLDDIDVSDKQALKILQTNAIAKEQARAVKKTMNQIKNFDDMIAAKFRDIDIPKDINTDKVLEQAKKQRSDEERADLNSKFYEELNKVDKEDRDKGGDKVKTLNDTYLEGATQTFRSLGLEFLDGYGVDKDLLKTFNGIDGIELGAQMTASKIMDKFKDDPKGLAQFRKNLKKHLEDNVVKAVEESLNNSRDSIGMVKEFDNLVKEGVYHESSLRLQRAKQLKAARNNLVTNSGSLTALSEVLNQLDGSEEFSSMEKRGWKDDQAKAFMKKHGIEGYSIEKDKKSDKIQVKVPLKEMHKLMTKEHSIPPDEVLNQIDSLSGKQLDEAIDDLKSGRDNMKKFHVKGVPKTWHDVVDNKRMRELNRTNSIVSKDKNSITVNEGGKEVKYEKFYNKPGEAGYRREYANGAVLYRAEKPLELQDSQKRMIKFLKMNNRVIWNAQAGIGKTLSVYGSIADLKKSDKDFNYALYTMPKDLVGEATKDVDKFMPGMKVAVINASDSKEKVRAILKDAHAGKYDVVLTSHNSAKRSHIMNSVKEYQPSMMVADEAHQIFGKKSKAKSAGDDPTKTSAGIKKIADLMHNSKYVVNMTGTVVQEQMDELAKMAIATRPDLIDEPNKFIKRYANVNQGTGVFNEQIQNDFRKALHRIMINETFDVGKKNADGVFQKVDLLNQSKRNPKGTDDTSIPLSPEQKSRTKAIEEAYQKEKATNGYFLVDKQTRMPVYDEGGNIQKVGFKGRGKVKQADKIAHMQKNNIDHTKYDYERGGKEASYNRKQKRHEVNIRNGNHETNSKFQELRKNIERHAKRDPNEKQIIHFNSKDTKKTLMNMLKDMGYDHSQIAVLDTTQKKAVQEKQKKAFLNDPKVKFIVGDHAMSTGQNLQRGGVTHIIEPPETNAKRDQQIARSHRRGAENYRGASYVHEYFSNSPIEQSKKLELDQQKRMTSAIGNYDKSKNLKEQFDKKNKKADKVKTTKTKKNKVSNKKAA